MSSLKEIKTRIQSVKSTQKITSAMKMISSAKLQKGQKAVENLFPYKERLSNMLFNLLSVRDMDGFSPYAEIRDVKRVAIVVFSSNTSLCGSFNNNVIKKLVQVVGNYKHLNKENILLYPIGNRVAKACAKLDLQVKGNFEKLIEKPNYDEISELADTLMHFFKVNEIDQVEVIYHHFNSKSSQELLTENLLPFKISLPDKGKYLSDYIIEPGRSEILNEMIPKVIRMKLFSALLDSYASEHAARTIAMQTATENADELLFDLSLQYNKTRQQAITNELLDIVGGTLNK